LPWCNISAILLRQHRIEDPHDEALLSARQVLDTFHLLLQLRAGPGFLAATADSSPSNSSKETPKGAAFDEDLTLPDDVPQGLR
jgi:hypothetical protein